MSPTTTALSTDVLVIGWGLAGLVAAAEAVAGGRRVSVLSGWGDDNAQAAFLRDAHAGACRWFDSVLGPDYNAAHRDHFHLETGGWQTCR